MNRYLLVVSVVVLISGCADPEDDPGPSQAEDSGVDSRVDDVLADADVRPDTEVTPDVPDAPDPADAPSDADAAEVPDAGDLGVDGADGDADVGTDVDAEPDADADNDVEDPEPGTPEGLANVHASFVADGAVLAAAGTDVDGDGVNDLAIGVPSADGGRGNVWLFFGPLARGRLDPAAADARIVGPTAGGAGRLLLRAGNLRGDAGQELAIAGDSAVWLVSEPDGDDLALEGVTARINLSASALERAPDHDGDGVDDLIVVDQSEVHLFRGRFDETQARSDATLSVAGRSAAAGDLDGDGIPELVVGVAPRLYGEGHPMWDGFEHGFLNAEVAELADIYAGPVGPDSEVASVLMAYERLDPLDSEERDWRVSSLDWGGDADADGRADLLVGIETYSYGSNSADGLAMVVAGRSELPRYWVLNRDPVFVPDAGAAVAEGPYRVGESVEGRENIGQWVRFAGDLNGDEAGDWLYSGAVFFHGFSVSAVTGAPGDDVHFGDITTVANDQPEWLPDAVVPVGDVTGDGTDDLAVIVDGVLYLVGL